MANKKGYFVTLGADPEIFVRSTEDKQVYPVCGLIGGTKEEPIYWGSRGSAGGYAYQEDGCAFEFNVPAAPTYDHMDSYMKQVAKLTQALLSEKKLTPHIAPSFHFRKDQLTDQRANVLGCSPDLDAYGANDGATVRKTLDVAQFGNTRFAGGHIHVGYNKDKVPSWAMARFLDVLVGLPSLTRDKQGARRQYYGLPGLFRDKPYGVEYRTLSNYWVKPYFDGSDHTHSYYLFGQVFDLAHVANNNPELLSNAFKIVPWDDVKDAITQENTKLGKEIWDYAYKVAKLPCRFGSYLWKELKP